MIIIFNGPPGAGKDEAANIFKLHQFEHLSFKEELFKATFTEFCVSEEWFMAGYDDRTIKERPEKELRGRSRRQALIYTSEDEIKPKFGKSFFGDKVASRVTQGRNYVISDGGFSEEVQPLIDKVGAEEVLVIQLTRSGCSFEGDSRRYINGDFRQEYAVGGKTKIPAEYILETKLACPVYRFHNNSSLPDFHTELTKLKRDINEKKRWGELF
jgi:hypothetical protein